MPVDGAPGRPPPPPGYRSTVPLLGERRCSRAPRYEECPWFANLCLLAFLLPALLLSFLRLLQQLSRRFSLTFFLQQGSMLAQNCPPFLLRCRRVSCIRRLTEVLFRRSII